MNRRMSQRLGMAFVLVLVGAQLFGGCADARDASFCAEYEELSVAVEGLGQQNPATASAEELRGTVDEVQAALDQFRAVSEGRLDDALSRLRASVDAVRQAAVDAGSEALNTARPLVQDALESADEAWQIVQDIAGTQCREVG